ncbi:flavin-containing monooxygenase 5-like isoform X2 [Dreissena polymorpha]|uniref:Flavin-containing monooxygenase n=1 Tax=Dreissena polymorpha TaxID=45954 RepID=A0A9D4J7X5_DREPO|nr:flavin-containing monooxygenase 5-like isoform X2 [Dreissena polymorpha]KAH3798397.1 hypothetical protein DPMN_151996 [Dreissena polymorpha]
MKVAIIGAGASGLTAIKCCLDEGLVPTCYERSEELGGLWNYKDDVRPGQGSVMKSTVINTSKEMMCYSDFPIPAEFPVFMHNKYVMQYFKMYAKQFGLENYIQFSTEIVSLKRSKEFSSTGQWDITVKHKTTGKEEEHVYDAVLVCTGHHADVHIPQFPGLDRFRGKVLHSHDFRHTAGYEGKRVLIVGIGNSGGDAAVELSRVASQVFLSTRRGSWILNRVADHGLPLDMANLSRFTTTLASLMPNLAQSFAEGQLNKKFDHALYSLKPKHRIFQQHPMVNDDLPNRIACGAINIKSNVMEFTENGVQFDDGTFVDDIDVVILATGYVFGFPFMEKGLIDVRQNKVELFKYMFAPELERPTLAVVGCFQPIGAIMPICELQCRLATRVFKGDVTLPSKDEMWSDIRTKATIMSHKYVECQRHTIQVDFITFLDELAQLNGCKPNFGAMFLRDPVLAWKCIFGPCTPYQFRLEGPGRWKGARAAIMTQWDRTLQPLKTRPLGAEVEVKGSSLGFLKFLVVFVGLFVLLLSFCMQ